jgi:hypothetical protein
MKLYFITDNTFIKDALIQMGIKEKFSDLVALDSRASLAHFIGKDKNFCRGSEMFEYLLENLLNKNNTSILIHGGFEILGLVNFKINTINGSNIMITKGICVPKRNTLEKRGSILLDTLKTLGSKLKLQKIAIFSLPEAKEFYEKNGFIEEDKDTNLMIYNFKNEQLSDMEKNMGGKIIRKKSKKHRKQQKRTKRTKSIKQNKSKRTNR